MAALRWVFSEYSVVGDTDFAEVTIEHGGVEVAYADTLTAGIAWIKEARRAPQPAHVEVSAPMDRGEEEPRISCCE